MSESRRYVYHYSPDQRQATQDTIGESKPTQTPLLNVRGKWIDALNVDYNAFGYHNKMDLSQQGKWIIQFPAGDARLDEAWGKVIQGIQQDKLWNAKVSPLSNHSTQIICVYTPSWMNRAEVYAAYQALLDIGISAESIVGYKRDQETEANQEQYIYDSSCQPTEFSKSLSPSLSESDKELSSVKPYTGDFDQDLREFKRQIDFKLFESKESKNEKQYQVFFWIKENLKYLEDIDKSQVRREEEYLAFVFLFDAVLKGVTLQDYEPMIQQGLRIMKEALEEKEVNLDQAPILKLANPQIVESYQKYVELKNDKQQDQYKEYGDLFENNNQLRKLKPWRILGAFLHLIPGVYLFTYTLPTLRGINSMTKDMGTGWKILMYFNFVLSTLVNSIATPLGVCIHLFITSKEISSLNEKIKQIVKKELTEKEFRAHFEERKKLKKEQGLNDQDKVYGKPKKAIYFYTDDKNVKHYTIYMDAEQAERFKKWETYFKSKNKTPKAKSDFFKSLQDLKMQSRKTHEKLSRIEEEKTRKAPKKS